MVGIGGRGPSERDLKQTILAMSTIGNGEVFGDECPAA